jgi:hypothetical protein
MAKTQPLLATPVTKAPLSPVIVAQTPAAATPKSQLSVGEFVNLLDSVPLPVCWTIFGISSVTLLIQIWNYLGS